jgi:hypothetical protein
MTCIPRDQPGTNPIVRCRMCRSIDTTFGSVVDCTIKFFGLAERLYCTVQFTFIVGRGLYNYNGRFPRQVLRHPFFQSFTRNFPTLKTVICE